METELVRKGGTNNTNFKTQYENFKKTFLTDSNNDSNNKDLQSQVENYNIKKIIRNRYRQFSRFW
jgi:hypothetical protein